MVLGRYTIQKVIGRGGMATVYLARNQQTERLVALKILDPEISHDPSYVERFRREARAAGRIRSDHVVAIYDLDAEVGGTLVLVMEYLEGQTVQQALRAGRLPIQRALVLSRHLFEGLAAAHENSVIHRDLKPANLFIEKLTGGAEKLKILDFGISKLADASSQELTRAGQTLGTLAYMAPEQIRGTVKGNDPRIDLYAAGVSMFLMLTNKRPIDADDTVQLLSAVLEKPPLSLAQAAGVAFPPALEAFIAKSLQKSPDDRYQSALEMRDALIQAAAESGVDAIAALQAPAVPMSSPSTPDLSGGYNSVPSGVVSMDPGYGPPATPPAPSGPPQASRLMLTPFSDDDDEVHTIVRQPTMPPTSAPAQAPPTPLAGRAPTPAFGLPAAVPAAPAPAGPPSPVVRQPMMPPAPAMRPPSPAFGAQAAQGAPPPMTATPSQPAINAPPGEPDPFNAGPYGTMVSQGLPIPPESTGGFAPTPPLQQVPKQRRSALPLVLMIATVVVLGLVGAAVAVVIKNRRAATNAANAAAAAQAAAQAAAPTTAGTPEAAPAPTEPVAAPAPVQQPLVQQPLAPAQPVAQPIAQVPTPAAPAPPPAPAEPVAQAPAPAAAPAPAPVAAPVEPVVAPVARPVNRPARPVARPVNRPVNRPVAAPTPTPPTPRPVRPRRPPRGGGIISDAPF